MMLCVLLSQLACFWKITLAFFKKILNPYPLYSRLDEPFIRHPCKFIRMGRWFEFNGRGWVVAWANPNLTL